MGLLNKLFRCEIAKINALKDENKDVRREAAKALGEMGWQPKDELERAYYLIAKYDKDKLVEIGEPVVEPLLHALKDENRSVRIEIAKVICKIGDERGVEPLIQVLGDDHLDEMQDIETSLLTAQSLGIERIVNGKIVDKYIHLLKNCTVRGEAAEALGEIGDERAVEPLIHALKDRDKAVRWKAAEALGEIGDERAVEPLIHALKDKDRAWVHCQVAEALGEIRDERAVEPLIQALNDENKDVHWGAAEALGEIGGTRVVETFIQFLKDEEYADRNCVVNALGKMKDERAVEPLIHALKDKDEYVRLEAAEALSEIGDAAVEPLIHVLKDKDWDVRWKAAKALGEIGDERAVEPLIHALKDKHKVVRWKAAVALGEIGDERAVEPLIHALKDKEVRSEAAEALGKIEDERAVEPLIHALKDKDEYVRLKAADALGKMKDERAVEPFIHAFKDEDYRIREKAARALIMIGKPAVEHLIYALKDKDYWVRKTAARVLDEIEAKRAVEPLSHFKKESETSIVGLGVEMSSDNKQDRRGAETLEILFDIDDLGGGFYGNKAWRIFMKNCDPDRLLNSVLLEGDISETLAGHERIFCIAVQNLDLSVITYLKESFESCEEKGLLPLDKRFIEGNVTDATSLVIRGSIDSFGKFVTNEWTRIDEDLCKECGWEYAPVK